MNNINGHKCGLVVGGLLGSVHLFWSILVMVGFAQPLLNFIFHLHFINPPFMVVNFDATIALALIVITSVIGYLVGRVAAFFWNRVHRV